MNLSFLKNPWVIAGGVGIGVILLMTRGGGSSGGSGENLTLASMDMVTQQNLAAMQAGIAHAEITAQSAIARAESDVARQAALFNYAGKLQETRHLADVQWAIANAGVRATRIQERGALVMEHERNAALLMQSRVEGDNILRALQIEAGQNPILPRNGAELIDGRGPSMREQRAKKSEKKRLTTSKVNYA